MVQPDLFNEAAGSPAGKPLDVHPFERAGCGVAPFRFVGFWPMPSKALQEANPSAFNAAMQDRPRVDYGGAGACCVCGTGIVNHCLISDARGRRFYVGTDCVEKTDLPALVEPAKKALALHLRAQREALAKTRREAARAVYMEKHGERLAREQAARDEAERAAQARRDRAALILAPFAAALADGRGGFCDSVAGDLRNGVVPFGRGERIALDILAKAAGRRNSKAYGDAYDAAANAFQAARVELDRA